MPEQKNDRYYRINVRVTAYELRIFQRLKNNHNLSAREVLELSGQPCEPCCKGDVIAFDKINGDPIPIPRGILKRHKR